MTFWGQIFVKDKLRILLDRISAALDHLCSIYVLLLSTSATEHDWLSYSMLHFVKQRIVLMPELLATISPRLTICVMSRPLMIKSVLNRMGYFRTR